MHANVQICMGPVAKGEVICGCKDLNTMWEIVMSLPSHILLESGRCWYKVTKEACNE